MSEADPVPPASDEEVRKKRARGRVFFVLRMAVTVLAFAWILFRVDLAAIATAAQRVSPFAFAAACALTSVNLVVGSVRWSALLSAYGASAIPRFGTLVRLNFVGFFYNTWLPGGLGGDAVRGVASRDAFGPEGTTGALAVVFVERVLGLVGLLLVVAVTSTLFPLPSRDPSTITLGSGLGVVVGIITIAALALGSRLVPLITRLGLPSILARIASRLPRIGKPAPFAAGVLLSLATQTIGALTGHVIVASLAPQVTLATSFVAIPLAMATAFLPFLVGGTGAREMAFVALYASVGVPAEDAVAASLLVYSTQLAVGAIGAFLRVTNR
jgi:uncharacterized membrane protein YbhN (UPF0104 family)